MNTKDYIINGIICLIRDLLLSYLIYKHFGFEITFLYLILELIAQIMGIRLDLRRIYESKN